MKLKEMICYENQTIMDVMLCIDHNSNGIAFIVNRDNILVGILTDGDIRRLLINGRGIHEKIEPYINKNFVFAYNFESVEQIMGKLDKSIKILPVVDKEMHLVDYVHFNENMHIALARPQLWRGNEYKYLIDAFLSTWISSTGKYITKFEESFSTYCGLKYGIATSNGTTALHLALVALGIGKNDEVIVPDITFAATVNSVLYTGATPVIVDVEKDSWCISPDEIKKAITPNTKAIIPVHLYGQPCDMDRICEIAKKHNLYIVEDCAEAHGAEFNGKKVGSFGIISCFSFFGNKVVTTGEGGMCVTNSKELNDKMRVYRDHGMRKDHKYYHEVIGYNYRMTNLQAAIGTAQVERIDEILRWREKLEESYRSFFDGNKSIELQKNNLPNRKRITWLVSILVNEVKRDKILKSLKDNDIDARAFFIPLSEMDLYSKYARKCKNSKSLSKRGINLPTTVDVDEDVIKRIRDIILDNCETC